MNSKKIYLPPIILIQMYQQESPNDTNPRHIHGSKHQNFQPSQTKLESNTVEIELNNLKVKNLKVIIITLLKSKNM